MQGNFEINKKMLGAPAIMLVHLASPDILLAAQKAHMDLLDTSH